MLENYNSILSLIVIVLIILGIIVGLVRYQFTSMKKDDEDDYYNEIL